MHLGGVQAAHELQDLGAEQLAGHQDREPGGVGGDEGRRYHLLAGFQPLTGVVGLQVLTAGVVVGQEERPAHVSPGRAGHGVQERRVETAEVRAWNTPVGRWL